jgi:lipoprotein-releasing system permease protein
MFFMNENENTPRIRQLKICGIFNTNLLEFDELFVFGDIRQIQHISNWDSLQVSGFEIKLHDFEQLEPTALRIRESVVGYSSEPGKTLRMVTIREKYPQIFDWLSILDMNVWVILILMVMVAGFNMISALLVLILERSRMIGTLKALGSTSVSIGRIFIYLSGFLISRGLIWGNIFGLAILLVQKYLGIIRLDPTSYFMEIVPVHLSVTAFLLLNAGALAITLVMLVLPAMFVSRISPEKTLRFD